MGSHLWIKVNSLQNSWWCISFIATFQNNYCFKKRKRDKKRLCGSWSVFVLKDNIFLPGQSFTCIGKYKRWRIRFLFMQTTTWVFPLCRILQPHGLVCMGSSRCVGLRVHGGGQNDNKGPLSLNLTLFGSRVRFTCVGLAERSLCLIVIGGKDAGRSCVLPYRLGCSESAVDPTQWRPVTASACQKHLKSHQLFCRCTGNSSLS